MFKTKTQFFLKLSVISYYVLYPGGQTDGVIELSGRKQAA